ncbi:MAG: heme exporter protein CcmD [Rhodospirillaceae bacterium]
MDQIRTFMDMGGYGFFVWPAYALAAIGVFGVWYLYRRTMKMKQAELDLLQLPSDSDSATQDDL